MVHVGRQIVRVGFLYHNKTNHKPLRCDTCNLPSKLLGIVTHLLGVPGQERALSSSSMAPFFFLSFFTRASTALSAHFSSSSPCFQPSSFFTAGLVKEKRLLRVEMGPLLEDSASSVSITSQSAIRTVLTLLRRITKSISRELRKNDNVLCSWQLKKRSLL